MWFIGVEVEQETSAPPPKKYPGSAPGVALSLCALIYSKITKITSGNDMAQIMIVGIQLYSSLSLLADNLCQC